MVRRMANLSDAAIRQALKRVELDAKQESLIDGEGRGTGRLVLVLKPMPTRVTADWMAVPAQNSETARKPRDYCAAAIPSLA
jgi:hypothetical protein